jgi:hypothetical protein
LRQPRKIHVRFGVPGLGFVDEEYDFACAADKETFDKNVALGYMALWIKPVHEKFVIADRQLLPWAQVAADRRARAAAARSDLAAPMVIRDALDGVVNPCDGKPYDSKRAYYQSVKDHGCVIVGNEAEKMAEKPPNAQPDVTEREIYDAYQKVEAGYKPQPLEYDE